MPGMTSGAALLAMLENDAKACSKLAPTALLALAAVASVAANLPAMADADSEGWAQMSTGLDTLCTHLDNALGCGDDWIADDKTAFVASFTDFKAAIGEVRDFANSMSSTLDTCFNAYIAVYVALAAYLGVCLVTLIGLAVIRMVPATSVIAHNLMLYLGMAVTFVCTKTALLLSAFGTATGAALAGSLYIAFSVNSNSRKIPDSQEFEKIRIDYKEPVVFTALG